MNALTVKLQNQAGQPVTLSDYLKQEHLVVYFMRAFP